MSIAFIRVKAFIAAGVKVRQDGKAVGTTLSDSVPDSDYPGYFRVDVALDPSSILIPPIGTFYVDPDVVAPRPAKDIFGELMAEMAELDELTLRGTSWERETWSPTRNSEQAWFVAEKHGISVVKLPDGKGWMAGKFDEDMDCFMPDLGVVDGRMDHCNWPGGTLAEWFSHRCAPAPHSHCPKCWANTEAGVKHASNCPADLHLHANLEDQRACMNGKCPEPPEKS